MERKFFFSFPVPSGPVNWVVLVEGFEGAREAVSRKRRFCELPRATGCCFLLVQLDRFIMGLRWVL